MGNAASASQEQQAKKAALVKREPWLIEPSTKMWEAVERGLVFLDSRMPDPIRVPGWLVPKHPAAARVDKRKAAA